MTGLFVMMPPTSAAGPPLDLAKLALSPVWTLPEQRLTAPPPSRVLDLFCGAGLAARGLKAAGFAPTGVDLHPQPNYPGPFIQADATTLDPRYLDDFAFIWASPPCLRDTAMKHAPGAKGDAHPDLITPTRTMLRRWRERTGGHYVIENVETAPLLHPITLTGPMFGLGADIEVAGGMVRFHLRRPRRFEASWPIQPPREPLSLRGLPVVGVYGGHARCRSRAFGGRGTADFVGAAGGHRRIMGEAMGISDDVEVTCAEISQGVPPAYAVFVMQSLMRHLSGQRPPAPAVYHTRHTVWTPDALEARHEVG